MKTLREFHGSKWSPNSCKRLSARIISDEAGNILSSLSKPGITIPYKYIVKLNKRAFNLAGPPVFEPGDPQPRGPELQILLSQKMMVFGTPP